MAFQLIHDPLYNLLLYKKSCNYKRSICTSYIIEAKWRIYVSANKPYLVQIMAYRLDDAKPLSEPMEQYYKLDP